MSPVLGRQEGPLQIPQGRCEAHPYLPFSHPQLFFWLHQTSPGGSPQVIAQTFISSLHKGRRKMYLLPCIVPAVRLQEIHISIAGEKRHQLVIRPVETDKRRVRVLQRPWRTEFWLPSLSQKTGSLLLSHHTG